MNKIILSDRMYVDKKLIPLKAIEKRYKVELYSEKDCVKCENLEFRSPTNELCKTCPAFLAAYRLYKEKDNYWSLPQGDFLALKKVLEKKNIDFKVVEKRKSVPFKFPIKFTGKLFGEGHIDENGIPRINQKILIKQYLKKKNGILVARPRAGKCVSGNSIISTSEGMLSIKELFNHYGYSDLNGSADVQDKNIYIKTRIGHEKITHFFSKWSKENYALKTKRGYSLTGTPEHPVLVIGKEGIHIWKRMDELCEGDYLCIQKNVPIWPKNNYKNITVNESKLLGYLTANGNNNYILNKNAAFIRFTSKNKKIIKDFISCLPTNVKIKRKVKSDETINIIIYDKAFRLRMVDLGLKPVLSAEKTIPLSVRKSSKNVVDAFLSGYLSCDSYITKSGIGLSSASKILIRQLQNLLLNYGVYVRRTTSKISWARNSKNPSKKRYFGLSIGRECSRKLLQNLNLLKAYGHLISNEGRTGSGGGVELNYIPYTKNSISRRISRASLGGGMYNVNGNQPKRIGEMGRCKNSDFTREMFSRFDGNKIHDISIKAYMAWKRISSETDFVYDKIVSIKKIGKKKVYDLTVPGSHSFIANGIVVHNTVLSMYVSIKLGERTCILANRKELIKQFYNTFMGDKSKNRKPMSNIPELQKKTGKEIIRIVSSPKDFKNLENVDILLVNYQKLVRKPKFMAKVINGNYNHLIVDEVHGSAAEGYLRVISNCSVMYRMGLSATPRRKDNRHKLVYRIMGNIAAKSESASLIPKIELFFSKVESQRSYKMWPHAFNWICSNLHLQKEILQQAFKDLRSGHEVIIIPLDRRRQIDTLVSMINKQAKTNNRKRNENWPKNLAIPYYDGVDRDKTLSKVDKRGPTILVAMRSMIKEGIDFARPSILYSYLPVSASTDKSTGAPLFEQLSNRVCTPFKKPQPVVRVWVFNNIQMFRGCISGLGWRELAPNKYNEKTREGKYKLDKDFFTQLKTLNIKPQSSGAKNFDWV